MFGAGYCLVVRKDCGLEAVMFQSVMFFGLVCGSICVQSRSFSASRLDAAQYSPTHGTYIIQCGIECCGRFDLSRLASAVFRVATALPLLSSRYVCENGVPVRWELTGDLPEMVTVRYRSLPEEAALPHQMEGRPPLHVIVCRMRDHDDLLVVMDHVATDARGMFVVLSLLADAYAEREFSVPDQPESRGIEKLFEQVSPDVLRAAAERSRQEVGLYYPWTSPFTRAGAHGSLRIVHRVISSEDFLRIHAAARSFGATVQDILLAAFASALQTLGSSDPVPLESVMDLRPVFGPGASGWVGNFSANYRLTLSCRDGLRETVLQSAAFGRSFKANHPEVVCALRFLDSSVRREMDILLPEDAPDLDLRSPFLSNVGVIPSSVGSFGDEITVSTVWIVTDFVSGRYPSLVAGTWNGSLHLSAAVDFADTSADRIFDQMISSLFSLVDLKEGHISE